jgi:ureidoglycolate dehydrogenase (NAD+)
MTDGMVICKEDVLKTLATKRLCEAGMPKEQAVVVADVLVYADLRGVYSHGVMRVEHYAARIRAGGMNLRPEFRLERLKPAIGLVDAQGAAGHVMMAYATEQALLIAAEQGLAMVGVKNNSHCGALAYYVQRALDRKMAAMVCVHTDKIVVPFGGRDAYFGTNPFAFGFPGIKDAILLDMATSEVAWGKILHAREKGQSIPATWAVDADGKPCTDPHQAKGLFPFGGPKGYGIAVMVEALTGLMIGGVFGPHLKPMYGELASYRDLSSFILVIDPAVFGAADAYRERTQRLIDELHRHPPAPGVEQVLVPGEIEQRTMERNRRDGIPVPRSVHDFLAQ